MSTSESTCWTIIRAAAAGSPGDREELAGQEVFIECFRQGGALEAAGAGRVPSFRAFLYGVVRNVARRFESRPVRAASPLPEIAANEESLSELFEQTWAQTLMAEAAQLQQRRASERGPEAVQRVEMLLLRFEENLPIRTALGRLRGGAAPRLCPGPPRV
jgi:DNA-directed RNA polymerase specialized sigma24 family protein